MHSCSIFGLKEPRALFCMLVLVLNSCNFISVRKMLRKIISNILCVPCLGDSESSEHNGCTSIVIQFYSLRLVLIVRLKLDGNLFWSDRCLVNIDHFKKIDDTPYFFTSYWCLGRCNRDAHFTEFSCTFNAPIWVNRAMQETQRGTFSFKVFLHGIT